MLFHIFTTPNSGINSYRICDISIFALIGTIMLAYMLCYKFSCSMLTMVLILFISGILAHRLFGVKTKIDKCIFGEN